MDVLRRAEAALEEENEIRYRVAGGESVADLYMKYDQF